MYDDDPYKNIFAIRNKKELLMLIVATGVVAVFIVASILLYKVNRVRPNPVRNGVRGNL